MGRVYRLILPIVLIAYTACQKPAHINNELLVEKSAPSVYSIDISDTLPQHYIDVLNIGNTNGLQFDYHDSHTTSYFEYHTQKNVVLDALSKVGFSRNAMRADTRCRRIDRHEFTTIREHTMEFEIAEADFFWDADLDQFEIYECLKDPSLHIVLLDKNSDRVLHLVRS